MSRPTHWSLPAAGILCACLALPLNAQAPGGNEGITVYGSGEMRARPNLVELTFRTAASAELTDDALVKYRDAKKRSLEAFQGLQLENLEIEEEGITLAPGNTTEMMNAMMRGMAMPNTARMQIEIASSLRLRLKNIEKTPPEDLMKTIGRLLDVAQDAGAGVGPSAAEVQMAYRYGRQPEGNMVKFVLRDFEQVREQAYELAVQDARKRAERLAKLNGLALGPAMAVQEIQISGDDQNPQQQGVPYYLPQATAKPAEERISSDIFAEIPFRVKLMVRYGAEPATNTAQK